MTLLKSISTVKLLKSLIFGRPSTRIRTLVALMILYKKKDRSALASLLARILENYGIFMSAHASIDTGLKLPHPTAIVIGDGVRIGSNVTIYQSVTIGGRRLGDWSLGNYPTIEDGCIIFSGAAILGKVNIGQNSIIGANSVVLNDVPKNSIVAGVPAQIISFNSSI